MSLSLTQSHAQHNRARNSLAGGVATAFRATQEPVPVSFASSAGPRMTDVDGNQYVDFALGFGPLLLGHSPAPVLDAVRTQLSLGLGYGASHPLEPALAEAVCRTVPSAELCVFSSTGSEAVHAALRIARAATGRSRVIKFQGHYHGWFDPMHVGLSGSTEMRTLGYGGSGPRRLELSDGVRMERPARARRRARQRRGGSDHGTGRGQRRLPDAHRRLPGGRAGDDGPGWRAAHLR